jgi:EAL domain-containing protein (putative c-di-GMP-specific phosphodiesterase class I)
LHGISMSINVSPKQFRDDGLIDALRTSLAEHRVEGSQIIVEITESTLMDSGEHAQKLLAQLRRMGIRTAVDDFGTGYSSLSYVTRFRPDALKLDKSFIDDIATDDAARTMVEGVIELAHKLDISVLSEGVETQPQLEILCAANCDEVQGYLLGRPISYDAFLARFGDGTGTGTGGGRPVVPPAAYGKIRSAGL